MDTSNKMAQILSLTLNILGPYTSKQIQPVGEIESSESDDDLPLRELM